MANMKNVERQKINLTAQTYLSEQEDGDLYDAYTKLVDAKEFGDGEQLASDYVNVWEALDDFSVNGMIDAINMTVVDAPEIPAFIVGIDWDLLKAQKQSLLKVIADCDNVPVLEHLEGIVALIDALQDYVCDDLHFDEALVFPELGKEDLMGSPWSEIHNDFEDDGIIHIDAWTTADDNEGGGVIAKINIKTGVVEYLDERAKTDSFAQESIQEVLRENGF